MKHTVDAVREALNRDRSAENCNCPACEDIKDEVPNFKCEYCGYRGRPATARCACYENTCNSNRPGSGCFHGAVFCPACAGGEKLPELIADVRAVLDGITHG